MAVNGILPVIPTPFQNGRFDKVSFSRMLDRMLPFVDGYTLLGSTGEAPSLPLSERMEIAEWALEATPKDKAVVVGVSNTSIGDATVLAHHAQEHGAAGVLCSPPFYYPNSVTGVHDFLAVLDAELTIELILYDNPVATRTHLYADDIASWSREFPHLNTVKLTDHDLSKIPPLHQAGLQVLGGDDPIAFRYLAANVDGVMIIAPVVFPRSFRAVWDLVRSGDVAAGFDIFVAEILPFIHVFGIGDEIATTKELLSHIGVFGSAETLPPLGRVDSDRAKLLSLAFEWGESRAHERLAGEGTREITE
jgi:4-hydroxy-tetrahydrodipicolinate synthase